MRRRTSLGRRLRAATAVGALLLMTTAAAAPPVSHAAAAQPVVRVSPAVRHPGGTIRVRARNLLTARPALVRVGSLTRRVAPQADGTLDVELRLPYTITPGDARVRVSQGTLVGTATVAARVDWRAAGRDYAHSFTNPWERFISKATVADLEPRWRRTFPRNDGSSDAQTPTTLITDGTYAYTCTAGDVTVHKIDLRDGSEVWATPVGRFDPDYQQCADSGSFSDRAGHLWVGAALLDDATGKRLNPYSIGENQPVVYDGKVILAGNEFTCDVISAWDVRTSANAWLSDLSACGGVLLGKIFVAKHANLDIFAIDPATGTERWRTPQYGVSRIAANGTTLLAQTREGLRSIDPATGKDLWLAEYADNTVAGTSAMTVGDGAVYSIARSLDTYTVYARSAADGHVVWTHPLGAWITPAASTHLILANHLLYVPGRTMPILDSQTGDLVRTFTATDPDTGEPADFAVPRVVANGHLYVSTRAGVFDYAAPGVP